MHELIRQSAKVSYPISGLFIAPGVYKNQRRGIIALSKTFVAGENTSLFNIRLNISTKLFNQYNTFYWIILLISVLQQWQAGFFLFKSMKKTPFEYWHNVCEMLK